LRILGISAFYHDSAAALIEDGRIAEKGTHQELVDRNGIYAAMYRRQYLSQELDTL